MIQLTNKLKSRIFSSILVISLIVGGFQIYPASADIHWTPPPQRGHTGQYLQTNGSITSWASAAGISGSIASTQIAFGSASNIITGSANLTYVPSVTGLILSNPTKTILFNCVCVGLNDAVDTGSTWASQASGDTSATIKGVTVGVTGVSGTFSNGDTVTNSGASGTVTSGGGTATLVITYTTTGNRFIGGTLTDSTSGATGVIGSLVDSFTWIQDGGAQSALTPITGSAQTIGYAGTVQLTWGATTGHTSGDIWEYSVSYPGLMSLRDTNGTGVFNVSNSGQFTHAGPEVQSTGGLSTKSYGTTAYAVPQLTEIRFTGSTGAATVNLQNNRIPLGSILTISDYDGISPTSNITIDAGSGGTIHWDTIAQTQVISTAGQAVTLKKTSVTNWEVVSANITRTPGSSTSADLTAQTGAVASIVAVTAGASASTYNVGGYVSITAVTGGHSIEFKVTYTDENSTARTQQFFPTTGGGSALTSATMYNFPTMQVRAKAGTAVTILTTTFTGAGTITYDVGGTIQLDH